MFELGDQDFCLCLWRGAGFPMYFLPCYQSQAYFMEINPSVLNYLLMVGAWGYKLCSAMLEGS